MWRGAETDACFGYHTTALSTSGLEVIVRNKSVARKLVL